MKCKGCSSELQKIEYQSRSADEAHSSTYRCPHCPLNIDKFYNVSRLPHLYLLRSTRTYKTTPFIDSTELYTSKILCVKSKYTSRFRENEIYDAKACNYIDLNSVLFKSYSTGPWSYKARSVQTTEYIGLNAKIESILCIDNAPNQGVQYIDFQYIVIQGYTGILDGEYITVVHEIKDESDTSVLNHLFELYLMGFLPTNLPSYINRISLGSMSNMTARAYDAVSAEDYRHDFSTKPDGERMWLVRAGSTWLYCRRLLDFEIVAWYIDDSLSYMQKNTIAPVLDLEVMVDFPCILIDILSNVNGQLSPYDRNTKWITLKMHTLKQQFSYLKLIHMREFFETAQDAVDYAKTVPYPTDGLVAISQDGTDMKKLKPFRSVELQLNEDGTLSTREGNKIFKILENLQYPVGSIIEVRFSVDNGCIKIHESFQRFDKKSPNTNSALDSIIESSIQTNAQSMVRTLLWRWSNKLRFYIYRRANSVNTAKNIILDIGSGSGQSTEAFDKIPDCSFILVEPDEGKCKQLSRRLGVRQIHKDPRSIITAIPALKQGNRKYHVLNTNLELILLDKAVVTNIKGVLRCSIASFSSHFIANSIDNLISLGIPFIGCYYSYNGLTVGDSIIDTAGITMRKVSDERATVKWGTDNVYDEPTSDPATESLRVNSLNAIEIVPAPISDKYDPVYIACSYVKVLISK